MYKRQGPSRELSEEFHADELRHFQFPRRPHHHVDGISTTDADGRHAQSARIGRMGVRSHHHAAREGIVFEHHLMDDARAGGPKAHAETLGGRLQEGIDPVSYTHLDVYKRQSMGRPMRS